MDKPPFGIRVRKQCNRPLEKYYKTNTCLHAKMCDVVLYARKNAEYYKTRDPELSNQWASEAVHYEQQNNIEPGTYPSSCDAAKVGATRKTRGGRTRRRRTRRRGARSSRGRPTR